MATSEHGTLDLQRATASTNLTDQVGAAVREGIRSGKLVPGELYSVTGLANEFNISRTPVREAMLQLAEAGLVRFERNRGFRILSGSMREIVDVFELRVLLEVPATRVAAAARTPEVLNKLVAHHEAMKEMAQREDEREFMRRDESFHHTILAVSGNQRLLSIVGNLRTATALIGVSAIGFARILDEHEPILTALDRQDGAAAATAMEEHLRRTVSLLLPKIEEKSGQRLPDDFNSLLQRPAVERGKG